MMSEAPVSRECDVFVAGGGPAGIAAACSAAAAGASVVLAEASGHLGGIVTDGLHRCLGGLYAGPVARATDTLNPGVQRTLVERMCRIDAATTGVQSLGSCWVLEFAPPVWQQCIEQLCADHGVDVRLCAPVTAVRRAGGWLTGVRTGDRQWYRPRTVVDCTGGGHVMAMAGDDVLLPAESWEGQLAGGFCVRMGGLVGDVTMLRLAVPMSLRQAAEAGRLPAHGRFTMFHPGPEPDAGVCKFAVPQAGRSCEEDVQAMLAHLKRDLPAFATAREVQRSPQPLWRHGRRLCGRAILTRAEILRPRAADGQPALGWWPIECWDICRGPTYAYPPPGTPFAIPAEALRSAAVDNLWAAGTCVSADAEAAGALRVAGICLATGQLAGQFAANAAESYDFRR